MPRRLNITLLMLALGILPLAGQQFTWNPITHELNRTAPGNVHLTGSGIPSNPCPAAGEFFISTSHVAYFCDTAGGNWNALGGGTSSPGTPAYTATVTAQTTTTVLAASHGQGSAPLAFCRDNSSPAVSKDCVYTVNGSGDVVFTWSPAFTGTIEIIGATGGFTNPMSGADQYIGSNASSTGVAGLGQFVACGDATHTCQYSATTHLWTNTAISGGAPSGAAGGGLRGTYPNPDTAKFASDIDALDFAACDGATDDTAAFGTMSALAVNIHIPAGLTCVINAPTIFSHTHIIGGPNSRLLKLAGSTTTYLITTSSKVDVRFENIILDGNSVVQTTSNLYSAFVSGGSDTTFDKVTFQNSGSPSNTMGGLDVFNSSVLVRNSTFASTTQANQFTANINNNIANRVQVLNNTFNSSQAKAIWIQNSGAEGICNAEVAGNYINNVTDAAADAGQTGNAISIFQCDYVNVHDNQIKTVRYAGIRVATSSWTDVHDNTINGAQETAIYCSELGGGNNHCHHNTILNSASGINMTNVSSRSPDARNVADYNTCINVSYYCVYAEHDIATNNSADGVPFAFIVGHGATSHDNVATNNTCTQSSASYYPVDVCVGVDIGMTGTSIVSGNQTNGSTAPTINAQAATNTPSNLVITGITKAASAIVSTSSTLPVSGATVCFAQISGMVEINGLCGAVSSPSGGAFTVAINSTGFTTFTAVPAGGTAPVGNALTVYSSGTTPSNSYAANVNFGNIRRVCSLVIGADNGSALVTADIAPQRRQCFVPSASHVVEITVAADAGTPAVVVSKNSAGVSTSLSASLATAASGGLACANAAGSGTGIDGATTCAVQITTTALAAGDWIETNTSASASTAKRMSISVTYTID